MTRAEIAERLRGLVRERLPGPCELAPQTQLQADLQLDSLQLLELVVAVENEFGICLEPEDEQGLVTVAELVAVIDRRLAAREASPRG